MGRLWRNAAEGVRGARHGGRLARGTRSTDSTDSIDSTVRLRAVGRGPWRMFWHGLVRFLYCGGLVGLFAGRAGAMVDNFFRLKVAYF